MVTDLVSAFVEVKVQVEAPALLTTEQVTDELPEPLTVTLGVTPVRGLP
jgi:hypothetical protein